MNRLIKYFLVAALLPLVAADGFAAKNNIVPVKKDPATLPATNPLAPKPYGATPTEAQVQWQRMEYYAFVHFGLNTYTGKEWGYGNESPEIFNPQNFDADSIVKAFKDGGMTGMIYTAKHHDGWCAWPTKTTEHNIKKSPWKKGRGDVVREFSDACKRHGIKFGVYLSPWDRNHPEYARAGYIKAYYGQIEELLRRYGDIFEIWFDGANGGDGYYGGACEKRSAPGGADNYYNFEQIVKNIRKLQPNCIIWGASHYGDARWGGSERGNVAYPHWHTVGESNPEKTQVMHPASCKENCRHIVSAHGLEDGKRWVPAEGDTPINNSGWFWHQGGRPKSPQQLMQVWFDCVGRGANLILNLAPDKTGRLDPEDVKSLMGFKKLRDELYQKDFARGATPTKISNVRKNKPKLFGAAALFDGDPDTFWCTDDNVKTASVEFDLKKPAAFNVVRVREEIRLGQRVKAWALDVYKNEAWQQVLAGETIGNQAMLVLPEMQNARRVRLRIMDAKASPCISELSLFALPAGLDLKKASAGSVMSAGIDKSKWTVVPASAKAAIDGNAKTIWTAGAAPQSFSVDMGTMRKFSAFAYLPRQDGNSKALTDCYSFEVSADGKKWEKVAEGEFGNLVANPIEQTVSFSPKNARYFRFTGTRSIGSDGISVAEIAIIE
ncbi:MAG: alpha-L-fucosidase [Opitutales bacterium]|nr:alpha-L-fucosidase [Opitutales bacterium]